MTRFGDILNREDFVRLEDLAGHKSADFLV